MKRILLATFLLAFLLPTAGSAQNKIAIAAHRGYWDCPEAGGAQNSIASLKKAQDFRCWGSEFDVHLTADNVVVVNHDPSINGKEIQTNTYAFIKDELLKNGESISSKEKGQGVKSKGLPEEFSELRDRLSNFFHAKVQMTCSPKGKGKINILFDNEEELELIMNALDRVNGER